MPSPSDLELIALEISACGEDMLAIGNWADTIEALAGRGLMDKVGDRYRINKAGIAALEAAGIGSIG